MIQRLKELWLGSVDCMSFGDSVTALSDLSQFIRSRRAMRVSVQCVASIGLPSIEMMALVPILTALGSMLQLRRAFFLFSALLFQP